MQELKNKVRRATDADNGLLTVSYSRLDMFKLCPLQYKLKYMDCKRATETSLPLELGSLCHYVLEQKGKMLVENQKVDYEKLDNILKNGAAEVDEKSSEILRGTDQLKKTYFDIWYEKDNASGMTYEDKMLIFNEVLKKEMESQEWRPTYFEMPFKFVWDNKVIIKGFIDRIDIKNGAYKTIDYKTSKKVYEQNKLATSLQFGIYALAILNEFGELPIESEYRFILLDKTQYALTKGWEKRLMRALDKIFSKIETCEDTKIFTPNPTPLCHWCNFCKHNPQAREFKNECEYYSLWQPGNPSFKVNKKWEKSDKVEAKRKLIF